MLRYIVSIAAMLLAVYGLTTGNFELLPYMMFFLGLSMLMLGLEEFKREQKALGWLIVTVFLLLLFVSIKGFLLN